MNDRPTHCQVDGLQHGFGRVQLQEQHDEDAVVGELVEGLVAVIDVVDHDAAHQTENLVIRGRNQPLARLEHTNYGSYVYLPPQTLGQ